MQKLQFRLNQQRPNSLCKLSRKIIKYSFAFLHLPVGAQLWPYYMWWKTQFLFIHLSKVHFYLAYFSDFWDQKKTSEKKKKWDSVIDFPS